MAEDIGIKIAGNLVGKAITSIKHQLDYLIYYEDNIKNLQNNVKRLKPGQKNGKDLLDNAQGKSGTEIIIEDLKIWLEYVEKINEEDIVKLVVEDQKPINKACCLKGWCPNWIPRHKLSRNCSKMNDRIEKLITQGNRIRKDMKEALEPTKVTEPPVIITVFPPKQNKINLKDQIEDMLGCKIVDSHLGRARGLCESLLPGNKQILVILDVLKR